MKFLCIRGLGVPDTSRTWRHSWRRVLSRQWEAVGGGPLEFEFVDYDDLFADYDVGLADSLRAVSILLGSAARYGWDWFRHREGVFDGLTETMRWTAGMVVQWVENENLRSDLRDRLSERVHSFRPDVLFAHSLGSLIAYDTLTSADTRGCLHGAAFVSLGSQIANPFVAGQFMAGRIVMPDDCVWYNLYNRYDSVFVSSVRVSAPRFTQVPTTFDIAGPGDHDATRYLGHRLTRLRLLEPLTSSDDRREQRGRLVRDDVVEGRPEGQRRAVLVGIDEYPREPDRLEGCVNDVFLVSSLLQELGYTPEGIRVVLNDRATATGIRERLAWLVDGATTGDELFFYYSGHGTRLPAYGPTHVVDRVHECIVAHDFDGRVETSVSDSQIYDLYSQLPYGTSLTFLLDCCHAGGLSRGVARVRGIDLPDDIRHRMLRWDSEAEMWRQREFDRLAPEWSRSHARSRKIGGGDMATIKLGRALPLRRLRGSEYRRVRQCCGHRGPFMPMVIHACADNEVAHEYRHGHSSYGAFTYAFVRTLRQVTREQRRDITYDRLVELTRDRIKEDLGYDQTPNILGPTDIRTRAVPWGRDFR